VNGSLDLNTVEKDGAFLSFCAERSLMFKIKIVLKLVITLVTMTLWSVFMSIVAVVTIFKTRRIYNEYLAKWLAQFILWQWSIKVRVHQQPQLEWEQVIYISNHTSSIDIFAILFMRLTRCRFFLIGSLRRIIPLGVIATIMGTFFTCPQSEPKRRQRIFSNADRTLRKTGESVYLSPEGERVTTGEIGHFNKGAFHLATSLKVPIIPFYIQIPGNVNPGRGMDAESGTINVFFGKPIQTARWKLEDLHKNKEKVRDWFIAIHHQHKSMTDN